MDSRSPAEALALAERALGLVPACDGAQASVTAERSLLLRFARSRPTQATGIDDLSVQLTVVRDGHTGSATTNGSVEEALAACARAASERAEAAARAAGGSGAFPGLPSPAPLRAGDGHDADTARLDPAAGGAALARAFGVAAARGVEAHGVWSAAEVHTAVASTAGVRVSERVTDAFGKVTCFAPDGRSGYASAAAVAISALDLGALAERAAAKATLAGAPARLEPGDHPVVMEAAAVGELLTWLGYTAFDGLAFAEGRSAFDGRIGRRVSAPSVNISDSPRYPGTLPRSFDAEGVPKRPLPLIQDGVAAGITHDTRSAALTGAASTGHALAPGGSPWGALPTNLVMVGGGARDEAELCRPVERGVYVTRLWYTNVLREKETLITGVTRDGTFLIEHGEVVRPLEDLRLTDSVLGILERVEALSARSELTSEGEFYGRRFATGVVCPALRSASVRFSA